MIDLNVDASVAVATLCRGPVNGLNAQWVQRFNALLDEVQAAASAVLVIRSNQRVFCAGADLRYFSERYDSAPGREELMRFVSDLQVALARLEALPLVSIAEINGAAMGGGLELALACDFRLLSESASVGLPEVGIGLIPGAGGTQRLSRIAGGAVARRMILSAQPVTAQEALKWGVVDWLAPEAELHQDALRRAGRLTRLSAEAIAAAKACLGAAFDSDADGFAEEVKATRTLLENPRTHERIRRFLDKTRASD